MTIVFPKHFVVVLGLVYFSLEILTIKNDHVSDLVSLKYFVVVLGLLVLILTGTIIGMTQVKHICTSIDILYLGLIFLSLRFASDH